MDRPKIQQVIGWTYGEHHGVKIRVHPDHKPQMQTPGGEWIDINVTGP